MGKAIVWENSTLGSRVDISGFDVILDMDELTAHRVVRDCDLRRVIIPDTVLKLYKVAYACE